MFSKESGGNITPGIKNDLSATSLPDNRYSIRIVEISFNYSSQFNDPNSLIEAYKGGFGYIKYIKEKFDLHVVEHMNFEGTLKVDGVPWYFFKSRNKFWYIPFKTLRHLKRLKPDIVFHQGMNFPIQVIAMYLWLPKRTKIVLQNHFEEPYKGIKKIFQRVADKFIDAYVFTSYGNAKSWIDSKVISDPGKCHEVFEGSSYFTKQDKRESQNKTGMHGDNNFLWVGRLMPRKDPLTMLAGFEKYLDVNPEAKLYMIYGDDELLGDVKRFLQKNEELNNAVHLTGKLPQNELQDWYNAADFYLSASLGDATSFALVESMACGCIPIATDIPSFIKITDNGRYGILYQAGSPDDFFEKLCTLKNINREQLSESILEYFNSNLSFKSIADNLVSIFNELVK